MELFVLVGDVLCQFEVPGTSSMSQILRLAKRQPGVTTYLGNSRDLDIAFFRLHPPPATRKFHLVRGQAAVDNVDEVLRDVEKVELGRFDIAVEVFGTRPSQRKVLLYIERPPGKFLAVSSM